MSRRAAAGQTSWTSDPFQLGVAAGCPRPDGFALWTRLTPDPLSTDPATPGRMESRFQIVSDVTDPKATLTTLETAVVEDGRAGVSI